MLKTDDHSFRLAIDSSGTVMSVAVGDSTGVVVSKTSAAGGKVCEALNVLIAEALKEIGRTEKDIKEIVVGTGPGSFTGVRTGVAVALGFAAGLGIPIFGANVLSAGATLSPDPDRPVVVTRTANPQENYFAGYLNAREIVSPRLLNRSNFEASARRLMLTATDIADPVFVLLDELSEEIVALALLSLPKAVLSSELAPFYIKGANARTLIERGHPAVNP